MYKLIAMYDNSYKIIGILLDYQGPKILLLQCPDCCVVLQVEAVDERSHPLWLKCLNCDSYFDMDFLRQKISSA